MKRTFGPLLLALIAWTAGATTASAASVTYNLLIDPVGTFQVFADVSQGDNAGLVTYGVPLLGGITGVDHLSPLAQFGSGTAGSGPVGFSEFRSPDNATTLSGGQKVTPPASATPLILYQMGQLSGNFNTVANFGVFGTVEQPVYNAPLLLATGTYSGTQPSFDLNSNDLVANVFVNNSGLATMAATVSTNVNVVPEPSSIVMAGLGGVGLLFANRRWRRRQS